MNVYFRHVYDKPDPPIALVIAIASLAMAIAQFLGPPLAPVSKIVIVHRLPGGIVNYGNSTTKGK